eukprot:TRINITY_DN3514_c0_g1_i1.p1 TRINITY_DN3514_c0_g1~~TRINITY_DN3514_c0_g1_i1.p1  ORF type:complete len:866 (+),score=207.32 TRINITY_DN3514_c0_g1_i1:73-2598(+)
MAAGIAAVRSPLGSGDSGHPRRGSSPHSRGALHAVASPLGRCSAATAPRTASPGRRASASSAASPARGSASPFGRRSPARAARDGAGLLRWVQPRHAADLAESSPARGRGARPPSEGGTPKRRRPGEFAGRPIGPADVPPESVERQRAELQHSSPSPRRRGDDGGPSPPLSPHGYLPTHTAGQPPYDPDELRVFITSQTRVFNQTLARMRRELDEERMRRTMAERELVQVRVMGLAGVTVWIQRDVMRTYFAKWILWVRGGAWIGCGSAVTKFFSQLGACGTMRGDIGDADELTSPRSPARSPKGSPKNARGSPRAHRGSPWRAGSPGSARRSPKSVSMDPQATFEGFLRAGVSAESPRARAHVDHAQPWKPPGSPTSAQRRKSYAPGFTVSPLHPEERRGTLASVSPCGSVAGASPDDEMPSSPQRLKLLLQRERRHRQLEREEQERDRAAFEAALQEQSEKLMAKLDELQREMEDRAQALRREQLVSASLRHRLIQQYEEAQGNQHESLPPKPPEEDEYHPPVPAEWWRPLRQSFAAAAGDEVSALRSVAVAVMRQSAQAGLLPQALVNQIEIGGDRRDRVRWEDVECTATIFAGGVPPAVRGPAGRNQPAPAPPEGTPEPSSRGSSPPPAAPVEEAEVGRGAAARCADAEADGAPPPQAAGSPARPSYGRGDAAPPSSGPPRPAEAAAAPPAAAAAAATPPERSVTLEWGRAPRSRSSSDGTAAGRRPSARSLPQQQPDPPQPAEGAPLQRRSSSRRSVGSSRSSADLAPQAYQYPVGGQVLIQPEQPGAAPEPAVVVRNSSGSLRVRLTGEGGGERQQSFRGDALRRVVLQGSSEAG